MVCTQRLKAASTSFLEKCPGHLSGLAETKHQAKLPGNVLWGGDIRGLVALSLESHCPGMGPHSPPALDKLLHPLTSAS